jgi:MinD superfamily P-loop ATPase
VCERICPVEAIQSERGSNNRWYVSDTRFGTLVHAQMGPGEENSGKLVTQVRKRGKEIANEKKAKYILNDGPPGIGCATISSLSGADLVLIVTEPTKSGLHDVERLIELVHSFNIPAFAIINKYDINTEVSDEIRKHLKSEDIRLLAKIPFDKEMVEAMIEGKTIVEYNPGSIISEKIAEIWKVINK